MVQKYEEKMTYTKKEEASLRTPLHTKYICKEEISVSSL